jgi:hypothetical protein
MKDILVTIAGTQVSISVFCSPEMTGASGGLRAQRFGHVRRGEVLDHMSDQAFDDLRAEHLAKHTPRREE